MNQPFAAPSVDLALPLLTICGVMTNLPESHADALATPEARENGVTIVMDGCPSLLTLIATRETYGRLDVDRFSHPRESYLARPQRDGDAYVLRVLSTAEEAQIRAFFGQTATRLPRALRAIAADLGDDTHPLHGILRQPAALTATLTLGSWIAAATAYSNSGVSMIPFFIFYSMFGMQRTIGCSPSQRFMLAQVIPAAIDTTS